MSVQLCKGDVVLVYINHNDEEEQDGDSSEYIKIGIIKYIGYIHGHSMTNYVGLELVESINNGHDGTINGYQYFLCDSGYGFHTKIRNIIRKLEAAEITYKMQEILVIYKSRLDQYVSALSQRDAYIEELKNKQRYLRNLLKESQEIQRLNINNKASTDKLQEIQKEILEKDVSKTSITLVTQKKDDSNIMLSDKINIDPITPITPITPLPDESDTEYTYNAIIRDRGNSNSTSRNTESVIFKNIDRKKGVFKVNTNKNDPNKIKVIFTPTPTSTSTTSSTSTRKTNKKQKKRRKSSVIKKNRYNTHSEYTKYSMNKSNKSNKSNKYKSKPVLTPKTEESISSDNPTETPQTEYSDYDDDEDENSNNMDSPYSIATQRASKMSAITPISPVSKLSNRSSWNKDKNNKKNRNIKPKIAKQITSTMPKMVHSTHIQSRSSPIMPLYKSRSFDSNYVEYMPSNQPQQQYAYSHIRFEQKQLEENKNIYNNKRLTIPSLHNTYNKNTDYLITADNTSYPTLPLQPHNNNNNNIQNVQMTFSKLPHQHQQQQKMRISTINKPSKQEKIQKTQNNNNNNNNNPYFHPTQIEEWIKMQETQLKQ